MATRHQRGPAQAVLVVDLGTADEKRIPITEKPLLIGSSPEADLYLADPYVSGKHAELRRTPRGIRVRDLGSRNGTLVQGIAVAEALIENNATLRIGQAKMALETSGAWDDSGVSAARRGRFGEAIGSSPAMRSVFDLAERIAPADLTTLILGETGTGKDVLARAMHAASSRAKGNFVVFDCGAAAPSLIESQLFGHVTGAFTGAVADHQGAFERASGGTLFLDEIGELALDLQPKLLRALEHQCVQRVGDVRDINVDVRIIAATHRDLASEVDAGTFRRDLYFRISAAVLNLPPLRDRKDDLPLLATTFASQIRPGVTISDEAMQSLLAHSWPGNIRELKNAIASATAIAYGDHLEAADFLTLRDRVREPTLDTLSLAGLSLENLERQAILQTLEKCGGNKTQAAKELGIATSTLYEKLKRLKTHG